VDIRKAPSVDILHGNIGFVAGGAKNIRLRSQAMLISLLE
jgi:hypothetical protein